MATNFADPDREPTDEELAELMREAFAGVAAANERALAAMGERIERERPRPEAARTDQRGEARTRPDGREHASAADGRSGAPCDRRARHPHSRAPRTDEVAAHASAVVGGDSGGRRDHGGHSCEATSPSIASAVSSSCGTGSERATSASRSAMSALRRQGACVRYASGPLWSRQ